MLAYYNIYITCSNLNKLNNVVCFPCHSFTVKLKWDDSPKANIALDMNMLMSEGVVILNTFVGSGWAKEMRIEDDVPYVPGEYFDMDIICQGDGFNVSARTPPTNF